MVPRIYTQFVAKKSKDGERLNLRISVQLNGYLLDLSDLGVHGTTRSDVARALLTNEIERLIREGFLKMRSKDGRSDDN
jgi:hypothetical protein